jgi:hypothetical protein
MREVSKKLGILAKIIDGIPAQKERERWKNSEWFKQISAIQDPIAWAEKNNLKIDGMEPKEWIKQQNILEEQRKKEQKHALKKAAQEKEYALRQKLRIEEDEAYDHMEFNMRLKLEHLLIKKIVLSLQNNKVTLNPKKLLSDENVKAMERWCDDISLLVDANAFVEDKIDTLRRYLEIAKENNKVLGRSDRWNITIEILSILKLLLPDKFFSSDTKKQITAYKQKKRNYHDIIENVQELTTQRRL